MFNSGTLGPDSILVGAQIVPQFIFSAASVNTWVCFQYARHSIACLSNTEQGTCESDNLDQRRVASI